LRRHLPLRDLIDGVDVIDAFSRVRLIALMHRIQTQESGWPVAEACAARRSIRRGRVWCSSTAARVALVVAQVVQMSDGNRSQTRVLRPLVDIELSLQDTPCCRAAERLVRFVDRGQQLDVGPCVELRETPSPIDRHRRAAGCVAGDQPRDLRTAQPVIFSM